MKIIKKFALTGLAGYVAPKHLKAIKETGNTLVAAIDPNDSVGIIDSFFPNVDFFTEFERFDRHLYKLSRENNGIDYLSICSPNYLHDAHCRLGMRNGADIICEKPLVLNPWNIDALADMELATEQKINNILQLRLHPEVIRLKNMVHSKPAKKWKVKLNYYTSRGKWYQTSWKGNIQKSGGLATNIGIHFFDMLIWIFGSKINSKLLIQKQDIVSGELELKNAFVEWTLSIDKKNLPNDILEKGGSVFRSLNIDSYSFDFTKGFGDLHTHSYAEILKGNGFGINEVRPAIELVSEIRNTALFP